MGLHLYRSDEAECIRSAAKSRTAYDVADPNTPETLLLAGEDAACVRAALSGLTWEHQRILGMKYFYDMTQVEIAQHLGVSEAAVSQMHRLALSRLKTSLELMGMTEAA